MDGRNEEEQTDTGSASVAPNPEEAIWVSQARQGDRQAFSKIVEAYQKPIFNLCYRMLNDRGEAEDAAQEAFIRAYMKIGSYDETRKFSSWLFSIASHHCIDRLRKRRVQFVSWDDMPTWNSTPSDDKPQPEEALIDVETTAEVHDLLDTLPPDYRAAVVLKYWHNLAYEDIAESLNTTVSAIKSRLFRARKMMAQTADESRQAGMVTNGIALAKG